MYFSLIILGIGIDQLSKFFAVKYLVQTEYVIIPKIFSFSLHYNPGIAFSIPIKSILFPVIVLSLLSFLIIKYKNHWFNLTDKITIYSLVLIYAGAISNIIDRLIIEKVIDFISIYNFPVFNLADSFISLGAILIIFYQKRVFSKLG